MTPQSIVTVLGLVLALTGQAQPPIAPLTPPAKIILDVDLAEDVDDAGALATLHALANLGEAEILGILISFQHYNGLQNREAWDQTAVLCAVRGVSSYWKLSEPGFCLMHARVSHGWNEWIPTPQKEHRYLVESMPPKEVGKVIEGLMLAPPRVGNR